jgi:Arc/MetJ-type ribon-helix-helix transcriptional regulator
MNIVLPREQKKWREAEVAAGRFAFIDQALAAAVADFMADDDGDLSWAKPLVDEARAGIARGEYVELDEFRAEIRETIAKLTAS